MCISAYTCMRLLREVKTYTCKSRPSPVKSSPCYKYKQDLMWKGRGGDFIANLFCIGAKGDVSFKKL